MATRPKTALVRVRFPVEALAEIDRFARGLFPGRRVPARCAVIRALVALGQGGEVEAVRSVVVSDTVRRGRKGTSGRTPAARPPATTTRWGKTLRIALRTVLSRRGLKPSREQEAAIAGCNDERTLERWLDRAIAARSVNYVLEGAES